MRLRIKLDVGERPEAPPWECMLAKLMELVPVLFPSLFGASPPPSRGRK